MKFSALRALHGLRSMNISRRRGSSVPDFASWPRMSSAASTGTAALYGRSVAVSASKMSAIVIMRVSSAISDERLPSG